MKRFAGMVMPLFSVLALSVLAGCGGGGGTGDSSSTVAPLASKTRLLQPGDTWVYDLTGATTTGSPSITGSGTSTITISSRALNGGTALVREETDHFVTSDNHTTDFVFTKYFAQDANTRDVKELAESSSGSSLQSVVTPVTIIPGSWSNGATLHPTFDFGGGDVETAAPQTVTGKETVKTSIGSFDAWMVSMPFALAGNTQNLVPDWAPQLGAPVRFQTVTGYSTNAGNVAIVVTALLKSTTVPR